MVQSFIYKAEAWEPAAYGSTDGVSFEFFKWGRLYFGRGTLNVQTLEVKKTCAVMKTINHIDTD